MSQFQERRRTPRILVSGRMGGRVRATMDVRIIELSATGSRIEHGELLRPGSACAIQFQSAVGSVILSARIIHSAVVGAAPKPDGERRLRYQSGLAFVDVTPEQRVALEEILKRVIPGGGVGDARLIF